MAIIDKYLIKHETLATLFYTVYLLYDKFQSFWTNPTAQSPRP